MGELIRKSCNCHRRLEGDRRGHRASLRQGRGGGGGQLRFEQGRRGPGGRRDRQSGGKAIAIQADVAKRADVKRLFADTAEKLGRPNILVNNAGVFSFAPLEAVTEEDFHRQFDTNVLGAILATRRPSRLSTARAAA